MTLIGLTGALMGVAASVAGRIGKRAEDHRLTQLEACVEHLESRLRVSESLVDHWRSEARRLAHERARERAWAQSFAQAAQYQAQLAILPQDPQAALQQAMAQQQQAQLYQQQRFCNCVPSRSQVLGAGHGLVERLNRGEAER